MTGYPPSRMHRKSDEFACILWHLQHELRESWMFQRKQEKSSPSTRTLPRHETRGTKLQWPESRLE